MYLTTTKTSPDRVLFWMFLYEVAFTLFSTLTWGNLKSSSAVLVLIFSILRSQQLEVLPYVQSVVPTILFETIIEVCVVWCGISLAFISHFRFVLVWTCLSSSQARSFRSSLLWGTGKVHFSNYSPLHQWSFQTDPLNQQMQHLPTCYEGETMQWSRKKVCLLVQFSH